MPGEREGAGPRVARNALARAGAEILGKLASLVVFAALARSTGQSGLGVFVFALAWVQIAVTPMELGLDRYLLRRIARERSRLRELPDVVAIKLALGVPLTAISFAAALAVGLDDQTRTAIYLLTPGLIMESIGRSVFAAFMAHERSELLAASILIQRFAAAGMGLAALAAGLGVLAIAATYSAGAALGLLVAVVLLARRIGRPALSLSPRTWRPLAGASLPFGAESVLGAVLARVDALILLALASQAAVGRYGAAYRLLESTFFVTLSLLGAFAAMFTYLDNDTEPTVRGAYERSLKLALAALTPIAIVLATLPEHVATLFFGDDFAAAADPIRLLAPAVVLIAIVMLSASLILSRRNPMTMVAVTAGMVAVNVVANLALVPVFADAGAAAAMLITEVVGAGAVLAIAARTVGGLSWARTLAAPLLAGAAMSAPMLALQGSFVPALAAGAIVYIAILAGLERRISPDDFGLVAGMVGSRLRA